jgi:hypothetical protein
MRNMKYGQNQQKEKRKELEKHTVLNIPEIVHLRPHQPASKALRNPRPDAKVQIRFIRSPQQTIIRLSTNLTHQNRRRPVVLRADTIDSTARQHHQASSGSPEEGEQRRHFVVVAGRLFARSLARLGRSDQMEGIRRPRNPIQSSIELSPLPVFRKQRREADQSAAASFLYNRLVERGRGVRAAGLSANLM